MSCSRIGSVTRGEDRPGVQLEHDPERGRPGDPVAGDDRVLHRGGAAPGREEREVQVDPAVLRDVQHPLGQQRPVGHHRAAVRRQVGEPVDELLVPRPLRLQDLQAELAARGGDRAGVEPLAPAPGASGRVTTATTSCREASSASRVGTATSGVPAKTTRIRGSVRGPDGHGRPPIAHRFTGSTRIRSAPSLLRALRIAVTSLAARASAGPSPRGLRNTSRCTPTPAPSCVRSRAVRGTSTGPRSRHRPAAGPARGTPPASRRPLHHDHPDRRRETRLSPFGQLPDREPPGIGPDQGLQRAAGALADRDHRSAVTARPDQRDHVQPAAQCLLGGAQLRPEQQQPGVQQHGAGVTALGRQARPQEWPPPAPAGRAPTAACGHRGAAYGGLGERLAQLLRRPFRADHGRPDPARAADRALPAHLDPAAPRAARGRPTRRPAPARRRTGNGPVHGSPGRPAPPGSRRGAPEPAPDLGATRPEPSRTPRAAAGPPGRRSPAPARGRCRR